MRKAGVDCIIAKREMLQGKSLQEAKTKSPSQVIDSLRRVDDRSYS